jgi:hypothetical protein
MHFTSKAALMLLLVVGACLSVGCSEETTAPDNNPPPPPGKHLWSMHFGDASSQMPTAVAVDASGNIFVTGSFEGTVDFGGGALTSAGYSDLFVAKYGPGGAHLWSKRFGDAQDQQSYFAVAVDASGNVILAGGFRGSIDFGGGALTSAAGNDIFVAKLTSDGTHLWSKRFGSGISEAACGVATDVSGNVIITGYFDNMVNFGGSTLTCDGERDIYVAKFEPDGTHLWSKRFGNPFDQAALAVATDASGNVIVAGEFEGAVDFGGGTLACAGGWDVYVAKFGPDGTHLWSKRFGDESDQLRPSIAVDARGNVVVTGYFDGAVDFGGGALTSFGGHDIFVAMFGSDGAHLWSKCFGEDGYAQESFAAATDASGNVIITGGFYGEVDFGGGTFTGSLGGYPNGFIAKFRSDGTHLWSRQFEYESTNVVVGVAVDVTGNLIVTGVFEGGIDLGGGEYTCAGDVDIFVAKFSP